MECWDPRDRNRVGVLDCALNSLTEGTQYVTAAHTTDGDFNSFVYCMSHTVRHSSNKLGYDLLLNVISVDHPSMLLDV